MRSCDIKATSTGRRLTVYALLNVLAIFDVGQLRVDFVDSLPDINLI